MCLSPLSTYFSYILFWRAEESLSSSFQITMWSLFTKFLYSSLSKKVKTYITYTFFMVSFAIHQLHTWKPPAMTCIYCHLQKIISVSYTFSWKKLLSPFKYLILSACPHWRYVWRYSSKQKYLQQTWNIFEASSQISSDQHYQLKFCDKSHTIQSVLIPQDAV